MSEKYVKTTQSGQTTAYVSELVIDTLADLSELPVFPDVAKGSNAIVLENSSVYMLGVDNEWHPL